MKSRIKIYFTILLFACPYTYGQMEQYNSKRELTGISGQWHKIILPNEVFGKVSPSLNDIRIFGITTNNDTVEAPYILRLTQGHSHIEKVPFKTLNISHNNKGYYITFETSGTEAINQIELEFEQQNFDWLVNLEGSQNQQEWFTVLDKYRILSIKNGSTDFQFTQLVFPSSRFKVFRLFIDSKVKPGFKSAKISHLDYTEGVFQNCPFQKTETKENKQTKQTEIDIELQQPVPISYIKIYVEDSFDYYRPVSIKYLADSFKTEQGWKYNYQTLCTGTLNSLGKNVFKTPSTIAQKLKILIYNHDNQPLNIDSIQIKKYRHELVARFSEPATYFLTYGNNKASKPHYDIMRFKDKIPEALTAIEVGEEQSISKKEKPSIAPLFKNKFWLWATMSIMILLLGWFSIKMIKKTDTMD